MGTVRKPELKQKCIELRVEQRRSLREIHLETGAPKGTLSLWLRDYPLSQEELRHRADLRNKAAIETTRKRDSKKFRCTTTTKFGVLADILSPLRKSWVAEAAVLYRLVVMGFDVYSSPFDSSNVDWVIVIPGGRLLRLQVKVALQGAHGLPLVSLRCSGGRRGNRRYESGEFDVLVGYDILTDTAYVWLFEELVDNATAITVCESAAEQWDKVVSKSHG